MTLSINTNTSALAALESLSSTTSALNQTENQVSTGLKVSSASDNPAIYAIASTITGNISGLSAVSDSLSFGAQVVNTATKASADILSTLQTLQNTVTTAGTTGIDPTTIESQVANAVNQINAYARSSTFNGVNVLTSTADSGALNGTANIVTGLQGTTLTIANQAGANNVLSNALGLTASSFAAGASATATTQTVFNGSDTGVNIATTAGLAESSFTAGSNVVLTNKDGTTTTFEFDPSGTNPTAADTSGANANHTVVILTSTTDSAATSLGKLVNAFNANGYSAAIQTDGSVNVTGQGIKGSTSNVAGLAATGTPLDATQSAITVVQSAIGKVDTISTTLGATTQEITGLQSFTSDLSDSLTAGVGGLTDADLSAASAKLTSLQTKQQLAIQSLSIANSQSQSILSLFRG